MADRKPGPVLAWIIAAVLILLLFGSLTMNGTWMGGFGMGGMMGIGIVLLLAAVYVAYRFGRLEQKVDDADKKP